MIKNYVKTAFRSLIKNKTCSFINVLGLGVGLTAVLLIFQYVSYESSFDKFHKKHDRIFRLNLGRLDAGIGTSAVSAGVMGPVLSENFAGIRSIVRLRKFPSLVINEETRVHEDLFYFTDSTFFEVFSYELLEGEKHQVLREPNTIVLTESAATRIFGRSSNLIGEFLNVDNELTFKVDGIAKDPPGNAHFDFDYLASIASIANHYNVPLKTYQTNEWYAHYYYNFFELEEGTDPIALGSLIRDASKKLSDPQNYELYGTNMGLYLQNIGDIHLDPKYGEMEPQGAKDNLYILTSAGLIILLLAMVNYTNLSTAQSTRRVKEVALRKTLGANKRQLVLQFLGESVLMSLMAMILAISLIQVLQTNLLGITGLTSDWMSDFYATYAVHLILLIVLVGLLGGVYPSIYLTSFKPTDLLKTRFSGKGRFLFRKVIVFLQFAISIVLISSTVIVFSQVNFMKNQTLGIDTEQIITIPTYGNTEIHNRYDRFRTKISEQPSIESTSLAELSPGDNAFGFSSRFEGMNTNRSVTTICVDYDYIKLYGLKLVEGRDFSRNIATDTSERIIINEAMCAELGWTPEEAIGKTYDRGGDGENTGFVIGVVQDFHFNSLRRAIFPVALTILPDFYQKIAIKFESSNSHESVSKIAAAWNEVYPEWPFDYSFVDQEFEKQYASERRFGNLFLMFTILGLFIGALGIYGLIQLMTEYRRKELSIRKVLGAQVWSLVNLLSKEYLVLMVLSFLVSAPIVYFLMDTWLADFAYNISIQWWMLAVSLIVIAIICAMTIGHRIYKSASSNPVNSLRYE